MSNDLIFAAIFWTGFIIFLVTVFTERGRKFAYRIRNALEPSSGFKITKTKIGFYSDGTTYYLTIRDFLYHETFRYSSEKNTKPTDESIRDAVKKSRAETDVVRKQDVEKEKFRREFKGRVFKECTEGCCSL